MDTVAKAVVSDVAVVDKRNEIVDVADAVAHEAEEEVEVLTQWLLLRLPLLRMLLHTGHHTTHAGVVVVVAVGIARKMVFVADAADAAAAVCLLVHS